MNLENIINKFEIKKGDKLLVSSNIVRLIINFKKKNITFNPNLLIDLLKEKIGKNGTLLFPTFNWDFCKGKTFNYYNTPSRTGSLSNIALKRSEFVRSSNPIYSFAVTGKDKEKICKLKHEDCYGLNSPFGYLIKNNGKHLLVDLNYRIVSGIYFGGFPFHHVAEQLAKVDYRYFKSFKGKVIEKNREEVDCELKYYAKSRNFDSDLNLSALVSIMKEEQVWFESTIKRVGTWSFRCEDFIETLKENFRKFIRFCIQTKVLNFFTIFIKAHFIK